MNKVSNIKDRIKEIAVNSSDSQEIFFKKIGTTTANFRGKKLQTGVNSDLIEKIVSLYPAIDLHWLITGNAKKADYKDQIDNIESSFSNDPVKYQLKLQASYINELEENKKLKSIIESLNKKIDSIKKDGKQLSVKS